MKSFARAGFTLVELLVGVVMMSIVIAGIAFTVSSGFDLFTKAESNAVVISGVRFTADSFERTVAPMLNVTDQIELLSADAATIPAPASLSEDIHYVFLSSDAVVHRDSKGDHVLEGSEYIDSLEFMIPVSSEDTQENYIFKMGIHGKNSDQPKAKLDLEVESALYNRPEKKGTPVSGILRGAILKIRASLYLDRLDLYDNDTKIKINGLTMHKGTKIEAVYDLINQTGTSQPMSDESVVEWFISGSISADLTVTEASPTDLNRNSYYWQLVSGGDPVTGKVLDTTGTFHLDTGATETDWATGVIRCRVTPVVKSSGGSLVASGIPRWSDYVVIKAVEAPSEEFEEILDVLDPDTTMPNGTGDVFLTNVATQDSENVFDVNSGQILMTIDSPSKPNYGASFVIQLKYDKFDNARIYGAWVAGRESTSDIPSYITVTNYSVVFDSKIKNNASSSALFLSTRSNNSNFGKIINNELDNEFKDAGYAVQYMPYRYPYGYLVSKFRDGEEIVGQNKNEPRPLGIFNESLNNRVYDYYMPASLNNSNFTFGQWFDRYRIFYTVLEYFDETQGKAYPRHIFRVRLLKRTDNWDALNPGEPLSEIKKRDPWCIGPKFYASEPMWFGDFVGNPNTTRASGTTTVKVKNYYYTSPQTATLSRQINIAGKRFCALKRPSGSDVFRRRLMSARAAEKNIDGSNISDTAISDVLGGTVLSIPEGSRYVGVRGVIENNSDSEDAVTVFGLDFAPGFSINEIRSIMPANGKLYSLEETIPASELLKIQDKDWYKSYKNIIASSENDINKKVFGTAAKSAGTGDNGSWYYQNAGSDGGIYDLQHIKNNCNCPLHNELFKWLSGQ
ncbi:MAG: hypothetical protein AGIKBDMD_01858 [Synergistaceae bacterium]